MTYVSWTAFYEGESDRAYFDILIPRLMETIILERGIRNSVVPPSPAVIIAGGSIEEVAHNACNLKDAFHLIFFHADTGGRNLEADITRRSDQYCSRMVILCDWPGVRCITILPRHEVEAWVLADASAVLGALGYKGSPASVGLPNGAREAERLTDPKAVLRNCLETVRGRRRPFDARQIFPAIAQRQNIALLRQAPSFSQFEQSLSLALSDLGCIQN